MHALDASAIVKSWSRQILWEWNHLQYLSAGCPYIPAWPAEYAEEKSMFDSLCQNNSTQWTSFIIATT